MAEHVPVMVIAIVIAVAIMMLAAKPIGDFIDDHPSLKMLALSFLILVGVALIGEGLDLHIPKGYIYFAMAFSVGVELLNIRRRRQRLRHGDFDEEGGPPTPVHLHRRLSETALGDSAAKDG
jgi:predicted tellurium resistance membrane protein TerC